MKKIISIAIILLFSSSSFAKSDLLQCYKGNSNGADYLLRFNSKKAAVCRLENESTSVTSCFDPLMSGLEIEAKANKSLSSSEGVIFVTDGFSATEGTIDTIFVSNEVLDSLKQGQLTNLPGDVIYTVGNSTNRLYKCSVR